MSYIFCIKTSSYASNFERELSGYCCGQVSDDDEDYGTEEAEEFREAFPKLAGEIEDIIELRPTEHGDSYCRACEIFNAPGNKDYKDVAIYFADKPTVEMIKVMKLRALEFGANYTEFYGEPKPITILGFDLFEEIVHESEYKSVL